MFFQLTLTDIIIMETQNSVAIYLVCRTRPAAQYEKLGLAAKDRETSNSDEKSSEMSLQGNVAALT